MNKLPIRLSALAILLLSWLPLSYAQELHDKAIRAFRQNEVPDNPYMPPSNNQIQQKPGYRFINSSVFTTQVNVDVNGNNIPGDAANEPSIAINPGNPANMLIGWRQFDNINSNFRQAGYGYTNDAGQSWTFPGVIEQGIFRSDPVLDSDLEGNFYYNSLTYDGLYTCQVFQSDDGGMSWDNGTGARGGDKQWMVIDKGEGIGTGNIYSFWTSDYSSCFPEFFTRSTNGGSFYESCVLVPGYPRWGTMAVGPDGELYIVGQSEWSSLVVAKSTTAKDPGAPVSWDFSVDFAMDGYLNFQTAVNPAGLLGQAYIDVDRSQGAGRGNVYVLASMTSNTSSDPADVMFAKSIDGGVTWSDPMRVNDDPQNDKYQWFGTMSVAPDGRLDAVWLDNRDAPQGSLFSALYYAYSDDQGETWSINEKLSDAFDPHLGWPQQDKMGDYFDMESDNEGAHLAWANTLNGEQDVYYSHITPTYIGIEDATQTTNSLSLSCYPNPVVSRTTFRYIVQDEGFTKMDLINLYGQVVENLVKGIQKPGMHTVNFDAEKLRAGYYYASLTVGNKKSVIGVVKIK